MGASQVIEKLMPGQTCRKSEIVQVALAQMRAGVCLNCQRCGVTLLAYGAALVHFRLLSSGTFQLFPRARGAGNERYGALSRIGTAFLSPALSQPRVAFSKRAEFVQSTLAFLRVFSGGGGDLARVWSFLVVCVPFVIVTVFVAVAEIWSKTDKQTNK